MLNLSTDDSITVPSATNIQTPVLIYFLVFDDKVHFLNKHSVFLHIK